MFITQRNAPAPTAKNKSFAAKREYGKLIVQTTRSFVKPNKATVMLVILSQLGVKPALDYRRKKSLVK